MLIWYPATLPSSLISSSSFLVETLGFSVYKIVSCIRRDDFTFSLQFWCLLLLFLAWLVQLGFADFVQQGWWLWALVECPIIEEKLWHFTVEYIHCGLVTYHVFLRFVSVVYLVCCFLYVEPFLLPEINATFSVSETFSVLLNSVC